ncbi:tetratricopeptide repeat protein [Candidatus Magnetominusculus dajiuhuensis]|uniref:SPOR domain-containing protein n=1 Tax=Candidatus Magnetominusculus dajiuhuensis TaxID=3137712 RepID=UPI003B43D4DE
MNVPFLYDDYQNIVDSIYVKDLKRFMHLIPDGGYGFRSRYIGYLTFALNYWFHGLTVRGYHIVNLFIHIFNSFLMYKTILLTANKRLFGDFTGDRTLRSVAFFASALFVSHPIQTQAVTYIVQRFEILATTFYLLSIIFYIKARTEHSAKNIFYYITSLMMAFLAMKTKEIAFTIPITAIVVEFLFIERRGKSRLIIFLPMVLLLLIIPLTIVSGDIHRLLSSHKMASTDTPQYQYLITQCAVILTYIRLLFFPVDQNLDYDYPLYTSFFQTKVVFGFAVIFSVIMMSLYALYRSGKSTGQQKYYLRLFGFGILWFFITLSVQSGLVPLMDLIIEHRLYLPSIGFFIAVLSVIEIGKMRISPFSVIKAEFVLAMIIVVLCVATIKRNRVWQRPVTLWEDVVQKSPLKARGRYNLGNEYSREGRFDEAVSEFDKALVILPGFVLAYYNMGLALDNKGSLDEAILCFKKGIEVNPQYVDSYVAYGNILLRQHKLDEAMGNYKKALEIRPETPEALNGMGVVMALTGDPKGAVGVFDKALSLKPDYAEATNNKKGALDIIAERELYAATDMAQTQKPEPPASQPTMDIVPAEGEKQPAAKIAPQPEPAKVARKVRIAKKEKILIAKRHEYALASGLYVIQLGSFKDLANAKKLADSMSKEGYTTSILTVIDPHGAARYRVLAGKHKNKADARATMKKLKASKKKYAILRKS